MYQLTMSLIHDETIDQRSDVDSSVSGIPDLETGFTAFLAYVAELGLAYGVEFVLGKPGPTIPLAMWAAFPACERGPAVLYVELQETPARTDVADIISLMRAKCCYVPSMNAGGAFV